MLKKIRHLFLKQPSPSEVKLAAIQEQANQGLPDAQYTLATWYEKGENGLPCNLMLAYRWYQRALKQGHTSALDRIGFLKTVIRDVDMPNLPD